MGETNHEPLTEIRKLKEQNLLTLAKARKAALPEDIIEKLELTDQQYEAILARFVELEGK